MTEPATHTRITVDCEPEHPGYVAAYLRIAGDECAFVECYTNAAVPHLLAALTAAGKTPESVKYVVVTHAHLDHAGGASALMKACPNATLLAHPRAARHLIDPSKLVASATQVYGEAYFEATYGTIEPIPESRVRALEDRESFTLGDATLTVHHTAGHAKHHFVVHDPATGTVFTGDTFGLVYPRLQRGKLFAIASTSPTDFDAKEAYASLDRVLGLGEKTVCPTHFGEVSEVGEMGRQVRAWIARADAWVEDAVRADASAEETLRTLERLGREAVETAASEVGLVLDDADRKSLELDITLNAQGLAFVVEKRRRAAKS